MRSLQAALAREILASFSRVLKTMRGLCQFKRRLMVQTSEHVHLTVFCTSRFMSSRTSVSVLLGWLVLFASV